MYLKSVVKVGDRLLSLMVEILPPDWVVEYKPGEWVDGRAPLFIQTEESWKDCVQLTGEQVWEIEVEGAQTIDSFFTPLEFTHYGYSIEDFWNGTLPAERIRAHNLMVADRVKLIRDVTSQYYDVKD